MDTANLLRLANNFLHTHMLIVIMIVAAVAVIAWLRPKQTLRLILLVLGLLVAGYIIYYIGGATMSGISGKGQMIKQ